MSGIIDSSSNKSFAGLKMPVIINFYDFTGIKKFNPNDYKDLQEEADKKYKEKLEKYNYYLNGVANNLGYKLKIRHHIFIFIIANAIWSLFCNFLKLDLMYNFLGFGILLIINIILMIIFQQGLEKFISKYKVDCPEEIDILPKKKKQYLMDILNIIKNTYLPTFRILDISKYEKLFFGNKGCALVNIESGRTILYGKDNVKNVLLEHKNIGSTTFGSSYSNGGIEKDSEFIFHVHRNISIAGGSHSDTYENIEHESERIEHYEWHLDILTDFMEYPKLSVVFSDDSEGVEEAKIIYGLFGKK
jgi:hypothetical protein